MADVLLTYGWVRSTYAALRNLSEHGLTVDVSDTSRIGMSQWSKHASSVHAYRSHYVDEEAFIDDLLRICRESEPSILLPSHNETELIAKHRCKFPPHTVACVPDYDKSKLFNNKKLSYDLADRLGIPTPRRFSYVCPNELCRTLEDEGVGTVVIKLLTGNSSKGVFYATTPNAAAQKVTDLIADYSLEKERWPQVEEVVKGDGVGVSVLYWNGESIADFCHRRLREKIETGGTSTLRESFAHSGVQEATRKLFNEIGWHGLAMAEFKVCPQTGQFWFIEVNPRLWGSVSLAINSGVEFPYLAWLCAKQGPAEAREYFLNNVVENKWIARWLLGDLFLAGTLIIQLRWRAALGIIFKSRSDSFDDLYWDDIKAFIGQCASYLCKVTASRSTNPSEKGMVK